MPEQVMAAIDGSRFSEGVCDAVAWALKALRHARVLLLR